MGLLRLFDAWREWRLPRGHRRRIRAARRVLTRIHGWDAARIFGYLRKVDPLMFEELILESFAQTGFRVRRNRRYSGDGGIDGQVRLNGAWAPVQCKRYSAHINPAHVADFAAVLRRRRAPTGLFVHTGRTGPASREGAARAGVTIISGRRLIALLQARDPDESARQLLRSSDWGS